MPNTFQIALFCVLFAAAILWLVLVVWVFRRLRVGHPAVFEAVGKPDLIFNNTPRTNWLFLKFLYGREWQGLGDSTLSAVLWLMRFYLVAYTIGFAMLFASNFFA